jgi:hypothetical protein
MSATEQVTGTPDRVYDLVSVLYHALQGAETSDRDIIDAVQRGDDELADFLHDVQESDRVIAARAKRLLRDRLDS